MWVPFPGDVCLFGDQTRAKCPAFRPAGRILVAGGLCRGYGLHRAGGLCGRLAGRPVARAAAGVGIHGDFVLEFVDVSFSV